MKVLELTWITATEMNNSGFEVERSTDNVNFMKIGLIKGNGTSSEFHAYKFTDNNLSRTGKFYYRLKQINLDGTFEYSKIINVSIGTSGKFELSQNYPNLLIPLRQSLFNYLKRLLSYLKYIIF